MKRYIISQGSLEMAHRSRESELVGRIYSQQTKPFTSSETATNEALVGFEDRDKTADTYNQNHPQIIKFYKKWGKRE